MSESYTCARSEVKVIKMEFGKRPRKNDAPAAMQLVWENGSDFDYSSGSEDLDLEDEEVLDPTFTVVTGEESSDTEAASSSVQAEVSLGGRGGGHGSGRASKRGRVASSSSRVCTVQESWCTEDRQPHTFPFTGVPGINIRIRADATELDYLKLFLTPDVLENIQKQTNTFAQKQIMKIPADKLHTRMRGWENVTLDGLWQFFGLSFLMGIVKKPSLDSYWSGDPTISTPFFGNTMSQNRYKQILQALHFQDNEAVRPENDCLWKIRPFFDRITTLFTSVYTPAQEISVDESLLLYKGRLYFKQYIPNKQAHFGVKSYELCEAKTGYTWKYMLYSGQDQQLLDGQHGSSFGVVMELMKGLLDKGYRLAVDHHFNSPELCLSLYDRKTHCLGTVRGNRRGMPKDLHMKLDGTSLQKGEVTYRTTDKLMALCWRDWNCVTMLSNCNDASMVDTGKKTNEGQPIHKAQVIGDYNAIMGGVDRSNQLLKYYGFLWKAIKWYKKLAFHLIDVAILNAHILYSQKQQKPPTLLSFRMNLVKQILQQSRADPSAGDQGGRPGTTVHPVRLTARHFPSLILSKSKEHKAVFRQCVMCNQGSGHRHQKEFQHGSLNLAWIISGKVCLNIEIWFKCN
ncbi:piggyBac transposable element-derived protein 4-like isoform X2 [Acipenser ruthenus]|uniref:piggyBac transposable element-derived protein 4-like isoform X2 n=1 Tax=Acipenser ruthenus TaxID=7906 RepID=UPI00274296DA|nr:piggyBac transposable element-derived protein 4-like isoform X2 [Acipenser ruthenus]